jgi:hypothetical protein
MRFLCAGGAVGCGQRTVGLFLHERTKREYGAMHLQDLLKDLADRGYCTLEEDEEHLYHCKVTPLGRDLVDYYVTCPDAIARPPRPMIPNA